MKAAVYEKRGAPGVFALREVETPRPAGNEVLVKIHASSVNALDYRLIRMGVGIPKRRIFGAAIAGRVEAAGKNMRLFRPGDEVFGDIADCGLGGFAEYAAVPESLLVRKPSGVTFEEAASLPVAADTALQALRDKGNVKPGQKVLIYGAGGGVGTFAVQLANHFGAHATAVCGEGSLAMARSLGADRVIDYRREDCLKGKDRYDLILAINGGRPLHLYKRALNPGGKCVVVGGAMPQIIKALAMGAILSAGSRKIQVLSARPSQQNLSFLAELVRTGKVKPAIDRRYPLSEAGAALQYLMQGHARGKVIVSVVKEEG